MTFISAGTPEAENLPDSPQVKETITNVIPITVRSQDGDVVRGSRSPVEKKTETNQTEFDRATAKLNPPQQSMANMSLQQLPAANNITRKGNDKAAADPTSATKDDRHEGSDLDTESSNILFTMDLNGFQKKVDTGLPPPTMRRSVSLALSESSDEVILFSGRNDCRVMDERKSPSPKSPPKKQTASKNHSTFQHESKRSAAAVVNDPIYMDSRDYTPAGSAATTKTSLFMPAGLDEPVASRKKQLGQNTSNKRGNRSRKATEEAKILADYIANIYESDNVPDDFDNSRLNERDLGGFDGWQGEEDDTESDRQGQDNRKDANDWSVADLESFDDISTSSEELHNIKEVLAKRHRQSGIQYLVFGEAQVADDARWLHVSSLRSPGAASLIQRFEAQQAEFGRLFDGTDESDDSLTKGGQMDLDLQEDFDDIEDEKDLEERRKARMTDEQIAILLSKQEELGMGSNDLVLFNGYGLDSEDGAGDPARLLFKEAASSKYQVNARTKKRIGANFPSAAAFSDVLRQDPYNGFDVMDQERPSLRKRSKGRRGKLSMDLSDSELEQSIQTAWENDRTKKKDRKQERESLRAQGLLGGKNKLDLKAKYTEGMSMVEVKSEIKDFLLSSSETLPLPPMAQAERKLIHEIANVFSLKSKSVGGGRARFPVLYRTSRTKNYSEESMTSIDSLLNSRRFLPRMHKTNVRGTPTGRARGGGFGGTVSYREGEVVGAAAPELGQENRGRAMLEKMGWSTGTALGALNNKGITQPVTQIVKTSKAGLG